MSPPYWPPSPKRRLPLPLSIQPPMTVPAPRRHQSTPGRFGRATQRMCLARRHTNIIRYELEKLLVNH